MAEYGLSAQIKCHLMAIVWDLKLEINRVLMFIPIFRSLLRKTIAISETDPRNMW
jgi:hypothetical protein